MSDFDYLRFNDLSLQRLELLIEINKKEEQIQQEVEKVKKKHLQEEIKSYKRDFIKISKELGDSPDTLNQ